METLETAACRGKAKLIPACTEINSDADAKITAIVAKEVRSRSFVVRQIVHAWAAMSHKDRMAALRSAS
jgi:hypothetical protein